MMNPEAPPNKQDIVTALKSEFDYKLCGYLYGKSVMRDSLVARYGWSELKAEQTLDELERLGHVRFNGDPTRASQRGADWSFVLSSRGTHDHLPRGDPFVSAT